MIAGAVQEDLRLVFETAEGAGMYHSVPVALIFGAPLGRRFLVNPPARFGAELRVRSERGPFLLLQLLPTYRHSRATLPGWPRPSTRIAGGSHPQSNCSGRTRRP